MTKQLNTRLAALHGAGLYQGFTREQFIDRLLSIGCNVYEKQILPYELQASAPPLPPELSRPDTGVKAVIIQFPRLDHSRRG
jgi:hypothetical protein